MKYTRSFLKWAGSKHSCLHQIIPEFPQAKRLIEPFVGSGTVFINSNYPCYLLAEENQDLINLFSYLKKEGDKFITYCQKFFTLKNNTPERYYALRDEFNRLGQTRRRAALFMYLNRHGYNGLCRFNSMGGYNVPMGSYVKPRFPKKEMMHFYQSSQDATFVKADFRETFAEAKFGDLIYCDPPYAPIEQASNFSAYTKGGFDEKDHLDLTALATKVAQKGVVVVISNHDTGFTRELYSEAALRSFPVGRKISSNICGRQPVQELLAVFS